MKAIVQTGHGPAGLILQDMPIPTPQAGELLVKVSAIAVNYANKLLRDGAFLPGSLPSIMFGEIEGEIAALGTGVEEFRTGQRVTGVSMQGFAEYAIVHASQALPLPEGMGAGQGLLSGGYTAYHLFAQAGGEITSVIVTGAGGVIGSWLIQLARMKGVPVIAALTGTRDKWAYVQQLGATATAAHEGADWLQQLASAKPDGYSVLFDAGGGEIPSQLLGLLAPGGTAVLYGNMSGNPVQADGNLMAFKGLKIAGASVMAAGMQEKRQWHAELANAVVNGTAGIPSTALPLEHFREAFTALESRRVSGRIILLPA